MIIAINLKILTCLVRPAEELAKDGAEAPQFHGSALIRSNRRIKGGGFFEVEEPVNFKSALLLNPGDHAVECDVNAYVFNNKAGLSLRVLKQLKTKAQPS